MSFFYERVETEDKIVITYKNMIIYYMVYVGLVTLAIILMPLSRIVPLLCLAAPFVIVALLALWLHMRGVNSEIKKAMKKKKVIVSGSKFSNSNPMRFEIPKTSQPASAQEQQ